MRCASQLITVVYIRTKDNYDKTTGDMHNSFPVAGMGASRLDSRIHTTIRNEGEESK